MSHFHQGLFQSHGKCGWQDSRPSTSSGQFPAEREGCTVVPKAGAILSPVSDENRDLAVTVPLAGRVQLRSAPTPVTQRPHSPCSYPVVKDVPTLQANPSRKGRDNSIPQTINFFLIIVSLSFQFCIPRRSLPTALL